MSACLKGISSMATRRVLAELAARWPTQSGMAVAIESVGGVDAAARVRDGLGGYDVVFLASDAIDRLAAAGRLLPGSKVDLMLSATAVAVPAGRPHPAIGSEAAVRAAVLAADRIACSTGPSGVALRALFERWGIAARVGPRIVQAPPGVPVAELLAGNAAGLGFQQLSELVGAPGIEVVGPLPPSIAIDTVFSAAAVAGTAHAGAVASLLAFMAAPVTAELKRRHGMHQPQPILPSALPLECL